MRTLLERVAHTTLPLLMSAVVLVIAVVCPSQAMSPQIAAITLETLAAAAFTNTGGSNWVFDGYLTCDFRGYGYLISGCYPNGQGRQHVTGQTFTQCMALELQAWAQMIEILIKNNGPPYGPAQTYGGCTNDGSPPTPADNSSVLACSSPRFANYNLPTAYAQILGRTSGAACYACVQGPGWYPCIAGAIGCSNPPAPGSCTPFL